MRWNTGAQEFGLDPFPWKSPEQTPPPPRDRPTLQVGSPFTVRRKTVLLLSESPHGGQPLVSGVPRRAPSLRPGPHGSHLLVRDPVWRKRKTLMRSQEPSPPVCLRPK